jgi:hypothetical protein
MDLKKLFRKDAMESSPIVEVSSGKPGEEIPEGFFVSIAGKSVELGFYCPNPACKLTLKTGADDEKGFRHCGRLEFAPEYTDEQPARLPKVRWDFPKNDGTVRLSNGSRVIAGDEGEWNGEVQYDGPHSVKNTDPETGGGLWGGMGVENRRAQEVHEERQARHRRAHGSPEEKRYQAILDKERWDREK